MKNQIKKIINSFGFEINKIPKGKKVLQTQQDAFVIQKFLFRNFKSEVVIFDVGSYVGEIALKYNNIFKKSKIYCFEPFKESFSILEKNTTIHKNIICYNTAFSNSGGKANFNANVAPYTNSLLKTCLQAEETWGKKLLDTKETLEIDVTTIDDFMSKEKILVIDILKLDTQGAEFLIIEGAKKTLQNGKIKIIYTEILALPTYQDQKLMHELIGTLYSFGFELFNFYNPSYTEKGQLRQVDAIFIYSKAF